MLSKLAMIYVEVIRNLPLLLQLFFWYNAVLKPLPDARNSIALPLNIFLNNRGLILPNPQFAPAFEGVVIAFFVAIAAAIVFYIWSKKQQERTGTQYPNGLISLALILGLPLLTYLRSGSRSLSICRSRGASTSPTA